MTSTKPARFTHEQQHTTNLSYPDLHFEGRRRCISSISLPLQPDRGMDRIRHAQEGSLFCDWILCGDPDQRPANCPQTSDWHAQTPPQAASATLENEPTCDGSTGAHDGGSLSLPDRRPA